MLFCMKTTVDATPQTYVVPVAPVTQSELLIFYSSKKQKLLDLETLDLKLETNFTLNRGV